MRPVFVAVLCALGCGGRKEPAPRVARDAEPPVAPAVADASGERCTRGDFAASIPVPEASGAALMEIDGAEAMVVVSDSGNQGAYVIVDPADGTARESGQLPLGQGANDDVESLAVRDGVLVGLLSSGWVLAWKRDGKAFTLTDGPYPLADLATGLACNPRRVNCGKNYEALCLRSGPVPAGECVGLAGAKADGALYCLVEAGTRLAATPRAIPVSAAETLTGCDLAPDGSAWVGTNLFGRSMVYRVTGWTHPETARVEEVGSLGDGFPEAIAVAPADGGVTVWRLSDLGGSPSATAKYRCIDSGR